MPSPNQEQIDIIATQILFDAKSALANLKKFNEGVTDSAVKVRVLKDLIKATAQQMNGDLKGATAAVAKFANSFTGINPAQVRSIGKELQAVGEQGKNTGNVLSEAFDKTFTTVNGVRIALGALVSMLLFQVVQAFTQTFQTASDQARQLEDTVWRLHTAEMALSEAGQEITLKGLEDGITRIQKKLPIFSREDISQLVGSVAVSTRQLGLTEQQIVDVAESIAYLNVQSVKNEDLMTTQSSVIAALLGKQSQGVSQLGVTFNEAALKEVAVNEGLIEMGDSLEGLTDDQRAYLKVQILTQQAMVQNGENIAVINDYLDTNSAKIQENKAAWNDFLAVVGQGINNLIPNISNFVETLQKGLETRNLMNLFKEGTGFERFATKNYIILNKLNLGLKLTREETQKVRDVLASMDEDEILKVFPDPSAIKDDSIRAFIQSLVTVKDTATNTKAALQGLAENAVDEDALKALDDLEEKIQDIILAAKQAQEELDIRFAQKLADLDIEYQRKAEDAERNHQQKLEDINQDALNKVEDAKRKAREDERRAEEELLLKLKELRSRFLLDLEDALHARDARQVLRLVKEYQLDKQNILDRKKLEDQQRKEKLAADLQAIEIERQRRIESENIEYARRLNDLNASKSRETEDLNLWYKREQEDIQRNIEEKLERLIAGYIQEYGIHQEYQQKINDLLRRYFADNIGIMAAMQQYMSSLNLSVPTASAPSPFQTYNAPISGGGLNLAPFKSAGGFAEGGTVIASQPTSAIFGESGLEAATFTPLDRTGRNVDKIFGEMPSNDGKITFEMLLSPDLEARIVNNTLNKTADIITRVQRSK